MGSVCCKTSREETEVIKEVEAIKEYSWDKRLKADPQDFMIDSLKDEDICRLAGSVHGQQFVIQNCKDSCIFLLDYIESITIDDCENCKIVLGPVKGSIFIRDSSKCVFVVPCGQFRLRDCHHLDVFLHCATQPIIESSHHIQFACIRMFYNQMKDHMKSAGLSIYNNLWYSVHDFTPSEGESNWKMLSFRIRLQDYITPPFPLELRDSGWSVTGDRSVIPLSHGMPETNASSDVCLVLCCKGSNHQPDECADQFLCELKNGKYQCVLLTSRELCLQPSDAVALQLNSSFWKGQQLMDNPVVGLIFGGTNCFDSCLSVRKKLQFEKEIFISPDPASASRHAISFLQSALMHLG